MIYHQLPANTKVSSIQFISEMNNAIQSLPEYREGMVVCADNNGYWLEENGVQCSDCSIILSAVRKLVSIY